MRVAPGGVSVATSVVTVSTGIMLTVLPGLKPVAAGLVAPLKHGSAVTSRPSGRPTLPYRTVGGRGGTMAAQLSVAAT
eukprot:1260747-Prymnesium_polylepis.1